MRGPRLIHRWRSVVPGLSDYVVLVRKRSSIFLAGPPLVKAAIGEETTEEALGGAETHAKITGLGEYLCENDPRPSRFPSVSSSDKLRWDPVTAAEPAPAPRLDPEELLGIVPASERTPFDMSEVVARLVDDSDFSSSRRLRTGHALWQCPPAGSCRRDHRQQRADSTERLDEGGPIHSTVRPGWDTPDLREEHHRLHGRPGGRARRRPSSMAPR